MSSMMVAESLVAVLLEVWMEMMKPWFCQALLAALIVEAPPLIQAMQLVERLTQAEFPVERLRMSQMVDKIDEMVRGYAKTYLLTAVVDVASFLMFVAVVVVMD